MPTTYCFMPTIYCSGSYLRTVHIVLNPIALSMKYISKLLRSVKTMYATSASVLDNVMRCAFDKHSIDAVYHE